MKKLIAVAVTTVAAGALAIPAFGATKSVAVKDNVFGPKSITVKKNTTVKWVWRGRAPHNVVVTKGPSKFKSPVKTRGSYRKKFTRRGTYSILCTIHAPGMKMTVRVR